jgi:hypothetical protein
LALEHLDVAYAMLPQHNQDPHADSAKGRVIPFVIDGLLTIPNAGDFSNNAE